MKLTKKIVASGVLSLGLTMSAVVPATYAFDLSTVDLTKQFSNTLTARFNITEPTKKVTLSWADNSDGAFQSEAGQTITTSVSVLPELYINEAYVSVLLKVPAEDFYSLNGVKVIQSDAPDTPVAATHQSDGDFQYIVLAEKLRTYVDGGPVGDTINFEISFRDQGEYNFDIIAVEDKPDRTDEEKPTVTTMTAPTTLSDDDVYSFDINFSEPITYASKARIQKEIIDSYGASYSDLIFNWSFNSDDGTETLYVDKIGANDLNYVGGHNTVDITDLNENTTYDAQIFNNQ